MKKIELRLLTGLCFFTIILLLSCFGQAGVKKQPDSETSSGNGHQIGEYVVEIFEDKKGHLWFGTMAKGVARYDGKSLTYFTKKDGLCGNAVVDMAEDNMGNLWLATQSGLSKFDGKSFTNFTTKDGLCHDRVSKVMVDGFGQLWVGTWGGVCRFDGVSFSDFFIPKPEVELLDYQTTMNWITEILEDAGGNIWFGRDGYGACKFDGVTFTHFTTADGLPSNGVQSIMEDGRGNIWFTSRIAEKDSPDASKRQGEGGLARFDGENMVQFRETKGLFENDIYAIYEDRAGDIWIGANGIGIYRFDGESFHLYPKTDRMDLTYGLGLQSILEDKNGAMWFGFSGGLFRLEGAAVVHVSQDGPWE